MKPRGGPGLVPLRSLDRSGNRAAQAEARLRRAWLLVVGPTLVNQTRLLRAHRGVLVVGCWHPELIPSLRLSAEAIWPQLRQRLERMWKLKFQRLEVVPCDPPEPEPEPPPRRSPRADPLRDVLEFLRRRHKEGWTPGQG
jgi:hypothetical protein